MNLSNVSRLHIFQVSLDIIFKGDCDEPWFADLHDINIALGTIRSPMDLQKKKSLGFEIFCYPPFRECLDQDWDGMFNEVIRISDGKHIEVELQIYTITRKEDSEKKLYMYIMGKAGSLSGYPNLLSVFGS